MPLLRCMSSTRSRIPLHRVGAHCQLYRYAQDWNAFAVWLLALPSHHGQAHRQLSRIPAVLASQAPALPNHTVSIVSVGIGCAYLITAAMGAIHNFANLCLYTTTMAQ